MFSNDDTPWWLKRRKKRLLPDKGCAMKDCRNGPSTRGVITLHLAPLGDRFKILRFLICEECAITIRQCSTVDSGVVNLEERLTDDAD